MLENIEDKSEKQLKEIKDQKQKIDILSLCKIRALLLESIQQGGKRLKNKYERRKKGVQNSWKNGG